MYLYTVYHAARDLLYRDSMQGDHARDVRCKIIYFNKFDDTISYNT